MRLAFGIFLVAAALGAPVSAAPLLNKPHSWGKNGVSYLQYRTDAAECAYAGLSQPAIQQPGALHTTAVTAQAAPVQGVSTSYSQDNTALYDAVSNYQADTMMLVHHVAEVMHNATEACLRARGYEEFLLTSAQAQILDQLRPGTPARYHYLYSLAVDPNVLKVQVAVTKRAR